MGCANEWAFKRVTAAIAYQICPRDNQPCSQLAAESLVETR